MRDHTAATWGEKTVGSVLKSFSREYDFRIFYGFWLFGALAIWGIVWVVFPSHKFDRGT